LVRLPVDVIVTGGDAFVLAVKKATATIPIVFMSAGDPVGNGLVESLARLGENVTGLSLELTETVGKRLKLLREFVPDSVHHEQPHLGHDEIQLVRDPARSSTGTEDKSRLARGSKLLIAGNQNINHPLQFRRRHPCRIATRENSWMRERPDFQEVR
jgi:ABC transporter substrate binding protein